MWELDHKESWARKYWWFWPAVLGTTLESPLDCKEIQPVHPKGNQSWIFTGRTDAEAETPLLWPPDANNWLIGKDPDAGKDWGQGARHDRGWDGWMASLIQWTWVWSLACCSPWGREESDTTEWLNWTSSHTGLLFIWMEHAQPFPLALAPSSSWSNHFSACSVAWSCPTLCDPMGCSPRLLRLWDSPQKYWSGLPFPSLGDLPDPGIEPSSPPSSVLAWGVLYH